MRLLFFLYLTLLSLSAPAATSGNSGLAVVLIDMQEGFFLESGNAGSVALKRLISKQAQLLEWAVAKDVPVLVYEYEDFGDTDPALMKILRKKKYKIIQKNRDSGFEGKSRQETLLTLKEWKVDALIVAGINGPFCVRETIVGALEAGYDVMTTSWVIGNTNQFPMTFPNGSWYFQNSRFTVFHS